MGLHNVGLNQGWPINAPGTEAQDERGQRVCVNSGGDIIQCVSRRPIAFQEQKNVLKLCRFNGKEAYVTNHIPLFVLYPYVLQSIVE